MVLVQTAPVWVLFGVTDTAEGVSDRKMLAHIVGCGSYSETDVREYAAMLVVGELDALLVIENAAVIIVLL